MRAGELRDRLTIQIPTYSKSSIGEQLVTWVDWQIAWGKVQTSGGSEKYYAAQTIAEATHKILTRYIASPRPGWPLTQIKWKGKVFNVLFADESRQAQGELYLLCVEKVLKEGG